MIGNTNVKDTAISLNVRKETSDTLFFGTATNLSDSKLKVQTYKIYEIYGYVAEEFTLPANSGNVGGTYTLLSNTDAPTVPTSSSCRLLTAEYNYQIYAESDSKWHTKSFKGSCIPYTNALTDDAHCFVPQLSDTGLYLRNNGGSARRIKEYAFKVTFIDENSKVSQ